MSSTYSSRICLIYLLPFTDTVLELSSFFALQSVNSIMASILPNQVDTFLATLSLSSVFGIAAISNIMCVSMTLLSQVFSPSSVSFLGAYATPFLMS